MTRPRWREPMPIDPLELVGVGALDLSMCRNRGGGQPPNCRCKPVCATCGYGPHMAAHGPAYGEDPGSEPCLHAYTVGALPPAQEDG